MKKLLLISALLLSFLTSYASDIVWTGGTSTSWHTSGNWQGGAVPNGGDIAVFNGTSVVNSIITSNISVGGIRIETGYTGTITQSSGTITVASFGFMQSGGTFVGGSADITISGYFTLNNGTFVSTSGALNLSGYEASVTGGTFNHNNGTIYKIGGTAIWNFNQSIKNLVINTRGNFTTTSLHVLGNPLVDQPYSYTGQRLDIESGLQYYRTRYFDNDMGRFISRDPIGYTDGMNLYQSYFAINGMDPYGLSLLSEIGEAWDATKSEFGRVFTRGISGNNISASSWTRYRDYLTNETTKDFNGVVLWTGNTLNLVNGPAFIYALAHLIASATYNLQRGKWGQRSRVSFQGPNVVIKNSLFQNNGERKGWTFGNFEFYRRGQDRNEFVTLQSSAYHEESTFLKRMNMSWVSSSGKSYTPDDNESNYRSKDFYIKLSEHELTHSYQDLQWWVGFNAFPYGPTASPDYEDDADYKALYLLELPVAFYLPDKLKIGTFVKAPTHRNFDGKIK